MRPVADPWTGRMGDVMDNKQALKRLAERLTEAGFPVTTRNMDGLFRLGLEYDGCRIWFLSCDRAGRIVDTTNSPDMIIRRLEAYTRVRRAVEHAVEPAAELPCVTLSFTDRATWVCRGGAIGRLAVSDEPCALLHEGCWTVPGDPLPRPYDRLHAYATSLSHAAVAKLIGQLGRARRLLCAGDLTLDDAIDALRTLENSIPEPEA